MKDRVLPFKVPPSEQPTMRPVGNEKVGIVEIPVYGYLRVGEMHEFIQTVDELNALRDALLKGAAKPSGSKKKKGDSESATDNLSQLELSKFLLQYSNETATILLKHRIDPEWTLENTKTLPAPLVIGISQIFREELTGGGSMVSLADQFGADEEGEKGKAGDSTSAISS